MLLQRTKLNIPIEINPEYRSVIFFNFPIPAYKWLGAMSVMFPVCTAPGASFQYIRRIPCTLLFSGLRSPLAAEILSALFWQDKWSVDGWICCQITNPWQINAKPIQHQTFAIEKFRDSIVTTRSCPRDKNISFKPDHVLGTKTSLLNLIMSWGQKHLF